MVLLLRSNVSSCSSRSPATKKISSHSEGFSIPSEVEARMSCTPRKDAAFKRPAAKSRTFSVVWYWSMFMTSQSAGNTSSTISCTTALSRDRRWSAITSITDGSLQRDCRWIKLSKAVALSLTGFTIAVASSSRFGVFPCNKAYSASSAAMAWEMPSTAACHLNLLLVPSSKLDSTAESTSETRLESCCTHSVKVCSSLAFAPCTT
mmetsp:Transcript_17184/g.34998  ORF Transcript_17184/g.34998 Transcript_17184/m.34998 type:complete len:206 (-) Transcript_17184:108-725(-)